MIKKIHYCWFGGNPLPELAKKCMESWKKYCPDYEIIEWNESNFDINCCDYVKEAYEAKKWAFVSDYCRFYALYNFGGIYLDTDVELIKPIDSLPDNFVGFENQSTCNSGLIRGANIGNRICKLMLESYQQSHFLLEGCEYNTTTVCVRETNILKELGMVADGSMQQVDDTKIFPIEYFSPKDVCTRELKITKNTISIHHYDASWCSKEDRLKNQLIETYIKILPTKLALKLAKFVSIKRIYGFKCAVKETIKWLKR